MTTQPGQMGRQAMEQGRQAMQQLEEVPTNVYFWAMAASVLTSAWLFLMGRRWESVFVGLWAPTLISFGMFNKLLRPSREMQPGATEPWRATGS
ncbi:MAG: hypothetical protein HY689_13125 [Chloroflexi bacterium]|nr:hypothetical protein [Chloroflexota bacterium]